MTTKVFSNSLRIARAIVCSLLTLAGCGAGDGTDGVTLRLSGSAVGDEGRVLEQQIESFMDAQPGIRVEIQQTPDDASQRHHLYVQWLNARVGRPDVLQLDVIWTPEFAAAGWILPLDRFGPDTDDFFPATLEANRWRGSLYALPWFVDVGMLYWRTDLLDAPPESMEALVRAARTGVEAGGADTRFGIVWQGARYEGLVTVFLEYLGGFGGRILDDDGRAVVDAPEAVRALSFMRDQIHAFNAAPRDVLTWREEESRFAFQNGGAVMMRNWPYAYPLLNDDTQSAVAGRVGVAPMPAAPGGRPTATLGGSQLAVNARTAHPEEAYALIQYLTASEQMLERAEQAGQYPARIGLYEDARLDEALPAPAAAVREVVEAATPRPASPIYSQLSDILQISLHRALVGQSTPDEALAAAARGMNRLIEEAALHEPRPSE